MQAIFFNFMTIAVKIDITKQITNKNKQMNSIIKTVYHKQMDIKYLQQTTQFWITVVKLQPHLTQRHTVCQVASETSQEANQYIWQNGHRWQKWSGFSFYWRQMLRVWLRYPEVSFSLRWPPHAPAAPLLPLLHSPPPHVSSSSPPQPLLSLFPSRTAWEREGGKERENDFKQL